MIMIIQGQTPVMIMTHGSWSSIALLLWTMGRICRSEYIHQDNTPKLSALWWSGLNCTLRPYYGRHKIKSPSTNQQSQLFVQSTAAYERGGAARWCESVSRETAWKVHVWSTAGTCLVSGVQSLLMRYLCDGRTVWSNKSSIDMPSV